MAEIHYLISDASKKVDVEAHVLRYWEDELGLKIPRNDMGHRYYTDFHIRLFRQVKELKEKGYQLKAIKSALKKTLESDGKVMISNEALEEDVLAALKDEGENGLTVAGTSLEDLMAGEKMEQFQRIMNHIIGRAMEESGEKLSQDVSALVQDKVNKELDYLMRVADEKQEERFKQLDEAIRAFQRDQKSREEAAAARIPFFPFKRRKFGRNGNKL